MKISLCIPQYNRIQFLLKNLSILSRQSYGDIEVVISDDASTDDTTEQIEKLIPGYRFPLIYHKFPKNVGYDANLRKSMELASGEYCFLLGNDDTLDDEGGIARLVDFLERNGRPEIGFCNYKEDSSSGDIMVRAFSNEVIGAGEAVALKYYRSFSYVAGIILRRDVFNQVNTAKADGSVFVQMYFAARIIAGGGRFFMYNLPLVLKDIRLDGSMANSYRDTLMRKWSAYKPIDGGLKQVVWAVVEGFRDAGSDVNRISYSVLKNIYQFTLPYWLIDYRSNGAFVAAAAMAAGTKPSVFKPYAVLSFSQRARIRAFYLLATAIGFSVPGKLFMKLKPTIYKFIKR